MVTSTVATFWLHTHSRASFIPGKTDGNYRSFSGLITVFWKSLINTIWFRFKELFSFGNNVRLCKVKRHEPYELEHTAIRSTENAVFSGQTGVVLPLKFQNQSIERVGDFSGWANL